MKIGYRTLKTSVGAALAIGTAQVLGLHFYASAGILTILCIKRTKKRSLASAWERFLACLIGLVFGVILFEALGYHPWTVGLVILLLIPALVSLKAQEGIVTSSVIFLHLYTLQGISVAIIVNELAIIAIGIGYALLMNLYMPNQEKDLARYQENIEANLKAIFHELARFLREGRLEWDGKEIAETSRLLEEARRLSLTHVENRMLFDEDFYFRYFQMRKKQFTNIERVMGILSRLDRTGIQGDTIADFLDGLAEAVHPGNTARLFLDELNEMRQKFKESPLPKSRQEFETRAALLQFVQELEEYLLVKKEFAPRMKDPTPPHRK
ncbi:aromatic acid exporter family protein [Salinithrix halophila]|uniref:Aromatic acid exporter family protein n=1 Tax=Salinithrix halophila TaxID=1485204 RepID=A0ABV8JHV7_9BACL